MTDLLGFLVSLHNFIDLQLFWMYSLLFDRFLLKKGQDPLKVPNSSEDMDPWSKESVPFHGGILLYN